MPPNIVIAGKPQAQINPQTPPVFVPTSKRILRDGTDVDGRPGKIEMLPLTDTVPVHIKGQSTYQRLNVGYSTTKPPVLVLYNPKNGLFMKTTILQSDAARMPVPKFQSVVGAWADQNSDSSLLKKVLVGVAKDNNIRVSGDELTDARRLANREYVSADRIGRRNILMGYDAANGVYLAVVPERQADRKTFKPTFVKLSKNPEQSRRMLKEMLNDPSSAGIKFVRNAERVYVYNDFGQVERPQDPSKQPDPRLSIKARSIKVNALNSGLPGSVQGTLLPQRPESWQFVPKYSAVNRVETYLPRGAKHTVITIVNLKEASFVPVLSSAKPVSAAQPNPEKTNMTQTEWAQFLRARFGDTDLMAFINGAFFNHYEPTTSMAFAQVINGEVVATGYKENRASLRALVVDNAAGTASVRPWNANYTNDQQKPLKRGVSLAEVRDELAQIGLGSMNSSTQVLIGVDPLDPSNGPDIRLGTGKDFIPGSYRPGGIGPSFEYHVGITLVGINDKGQIALFTSTDSITPRQAVAALHAAGFTNVIELDCGKSTMSSVRNSTTNTLDNGTNSAIDRGVPSTNAIVLKKGAGG